MNEQATRQASATALRRTLARWIVVSGVVAASAVATSAWAHPGMGGGMGHGPMHGMMHGGPGAPGGPAGGWFMGRGVERMLDTVNATEAQRAQIRQITEAARNDLRAQHESQRVLRDRARAAFAAPSVDAQEVETIRQQMLAQHDASSKRMTQAMLDVSRVLTPEQRAQLAERMKQRQEQMQRRWQDRPQRPAAPQS